MIRVWFALMCLGVAACSPTPAADGEPATAEASPAPAAQGAPVPEANLAQWKRSCALCHVHGEGGAPRIGDAAAWAPRVAKGEDVLLRNTVEGVDNMPPLGYCMDCSADDFRVLIRFMAGS